jgi:hypothetical protein
MKLVAVSGVYMRLVAECLHHFVVNHVVFGRGICPLVTLLVPCVC